MNKWKLVEVKRRRGGQEIEGLINMIRHEIVNNNFPVEPIKTEQKIYFEFGN